MDLFKKEDIDALFPCHPDVTRIIEEIDAVYERFHDQEILSDRTRAVVLSMLRDGRSSRDS